MERELDTAGVFFVIMIHMDKKIIVSLAIVLSLVCGPFMALADGIYIEPRPDGDVSTISEYGQQGFINYENGIEKLVVGVEVGKSNADGVWIIPVPSAPENIEVDVASDLPVFRGDDVISKMKLSLRDGLGQMAGLGLLGQVWPLPILFLYGITHMVMGVVESGSQSGTTDAGNNVTVASHMEKNGLAVEVITAKDGQAIYDYLSRKNFNLKPGSIPQFDAYLNKDYSFAISWVTAGQNGTASKENRGIIVNFPTAKMYYPMVLTSAYGNATIPVVIRVLGHVTPEIPAAIKNYTKIEYYSTTAYIFESDDWKDHDCYAALKGLREQLNYYHNENNSYYPVDLNDFNSGDSITAGHYKYYLGEINSYCKSGVAYENRGNDFHAQIETLSSKIYEISSSSGPDLLISPELKNFYGVKRPFEGTEDYTKITIASPANLFTDDIWMKNQRPSYVFAAMRVASWQPYALLAIYLLLSAIAGAVAGWIFYRKGRKYALIGLGNLFSIFGLLYFFRAKPGIEQVNKHANRLFFITFSIIFIALLFLITGLLGSLLS